MRKWKKITAVALAALMVLQVVPPIEVSADGEDNTPVEPVAQTVAINVELAGSMAGTQEKAWEDSNVSYTYRQDTIIAATDTVPETTVAGAESSSFKTTQTITADVDKNLVLTFTYKNAQVWNSQASLDGIDRPEWMNLLNTTTLIQNEDDSNIVSTLTISAAELAAMLPQEAGTGETPVPKTMKLSFEPKTYVKNTVEGEGASHVNVKVIQGNIERTQSETEGILVDQSKDVTFVYEYDSDKIHADSLEITNSASAGIDVNAHLQALNSLGSSSTYYGYTITAAQLQEAVKENNHTFAVKAIYSLSKSFTLTHDENGTFTNREQAANLLDASVGSVTFSEDGKTAQVRGAAGTKYYATFANNDASNVMKAKQVKKVDENNLVTGFDYTVYECEEVSEAGSVTINMVNVDEDNPTVEIVEDETFANVAVKDNTGITYYSNGSQTIDLYLAGMDNSTPVVNVDRKLQNEVEASQEYDRERGMWISRIAGVGRRTYTFTATDWFGNKSLPLSLEVVQDIAKPVIGNRPDFQLDADTDIYDTTTTTSYWGIKQNEDGTISDDQTRTLTFTVKDACKQLTGSYALYAKKSDGTYDLEHPITTDGVVKLVKGTATDADGLWTYTATITTDKVVASGDYRMVISVKDKINEATVYNYDFNYTAELPEINVNSEVDNWTQPSKEGESEAYQEVTTTIKSKSPLKKIEYYVIGSKDNTWLGRLDTANWNEAAIGDSTTVDGVTTTSVTYKLEKQKDEGTMVYHLIVRIGKTWNYKDIEINYDGTAPAISDFQYRSIATGNLVSDIRNFGFGSIFKKTDDIKMVLTAADDSTKNEYYGEEKPEIKRATLYYLISEDVPQDNKTDIAKYTKKVEGKKADGAYTFQLSDIPKKCEFYYLYFEIEDLAGNVIRTNVNAIGEDNNAKHPDFIMVDDKAPTITNKIKSTSNYDYAQTRNKKTIYWYKSKNDIVFDVSAADKESGIFKVEAWINDDANNANDALTKDSTGKAFYNLSSSTDLSAITEQTKSATYTIAASQGTANADGSYEITTVVEDNAGNQDTASNILYVDSVKPTIDSMKFDTGDDAKATTVAMEYGYFFTRATTATIYASDKMKDDKYEGSGVKSFTYTLTAAADSTVATTTATIDATAGKNGVYSAKFKIPEGFKGYITVSAEDNVGNVSNNYDPKGTVIETLEEHKKTSTVEITLPKTVYRDSEGNPLYNSDITLNLSNEDTKSGLRQSTWAVKESVSTENLMAGTLDITSTYNEKNSSWSSTMSGDADWNAGRHMDQNLVTKATKNITVSANTNHITANLGITDNAGNTSSATQQVFSIDKTAPVITIAYDNNSVENEKYYKAARTATVTVTERNFVAKDCDINVTGGEVKISDWTHHAGTACNGGVHADDCYYTCQVVFDQDGDYTFSADCTDAAGHSAATTVETFTIDQKLPVISVSYDNNSAANNNYYQAARTATIQVEDTNFNQAATPVEVTAAIDGAPLAAPAVSPFTQNGDIWTATVAFTEDADYTIHVATTDQAGNIGTEYATESFTVDQTAPELAITGVADGSANQGTVAPVVQVSDTNMNASSLKITVTGANHGDTAYEYAQRNIDHGVEVAISDFAHTAEMDDLYTLDAVITDNAGNETTDSITFSVNRFGSVYVLDNSTTELVDHFYSNEEQDLIITETNVDTLQFKEIVYSLDGNIVTLEEGSDYTVESSTDEGSWKQYTYHIDKKNFATEGSYVVTIYSEDLAQNKSSNKAKGKDLAFVIDKTAPSVVVAGVEESGQYTDAQRNVTVDTQDNILLSDVSVYTDDQVKASATQDELLDNNGIMELALSGANHSQTLYVVARDAAGNMTKTDVIRFLITNNLFVQWYSNKPLCAGSTAVVVGGTGAGVVLFRRRKIRLNKIVRR